MATIAKYDQLDFYLIKSIFLSKKKISTWELTKQFYKDNTQDKKQRMKNLNYKHQLIKKRLKKMAKSGFLFIRKNGDCNPLEYILIKERVKFCKHRFPCGYRDAILILEKNDDNPSKWIIFQT
jgi:hypothetical protein